MRELSHTPPDIYRINAPKRFEDTAKISKEALDNAFNFAYQMCFGEGHHRNHRTNGQIYRKNGEKFCNTFQGKLAEIMLFNYFVSNDLKCSEVDYRIMGEAVWDDSDFIIN